MRHLYHPSADALAQWWWRHRFAQLTAAPLDRIAPSFAPHVITHVRCWKSHAIFGADRQHAVALVAPTVGTACAVWQAIRPSSGGFHTDVSSLPRGSWRRCHSFRLEFVLDGITRRTGDQLRADCARRWSSRPAVQLRTARRHPQSGPRVGRRRSSHFRSLEGRVDGTGLPNRRHATVFLTATLAIPAATR